MKINRGWIRELFRYSLAYISSLSIIIYVIWFTIGLFFPRENPVTINDIFSLNEISEITNGWELVTEHSQESENLEDIEYLGNKRTSNWEVNNLLAIALNIKNEKTSAINQFLQNGNTENNQFVEWDPFDIEKIIADLQLQKEKRVAVVARELWIDWKNEKWNYAKLAWIGWEYNWSLEQNMKIRNYLIANAQEIYKDKHWWNEWETLPLIAKNEDVIKMNAKEITWQVAYNGVTLKVSAPAWSFPEWTVLKIKTLEDDDSMTTFDITLKEVILMTQVDSVEYDAPMASFDISFYDARDTEFLEELQPAEGKYVSVVFDYSDNEEFKNSEDEWFLAIYHMEDNDDTSVANLVSVKGSEDMDKNTKSDSMSIYANALSIYILTVVSDLDEDISEENEKISFDAGYGWFIALSDEIVLSSTWTEPNATYTWKILSQNNEITLPDIQIMSWYNFWWRYNDNIFLWNGWTKFNLWNINNQESEESDLDIWNNNLNYKIYACSYIEESGRDICILSKIEESDFNVLDESSDEEVDTDMDIYAPSDEEIQRFWEEVFIAYNWAIGKWITTIDDINKAKLNTNITRAELAKMMVVFMSWVLHMEPVITDSADYKDVNEKKLWDLTWYIQLAYQYQIMWINADWSPMDNFDPHKPVSRWEFATVLSRVLFGNTYNQNWDNYYEKHIKALNKANILNDTNPNITEWRWWIMTMLYRSQL